MSNINIVIAREFSERVKKKSFILTTLLMPLLMILLMCLPALIMFFDQDNAKSLYLIDQTPDRIFAKSMKSDDAVNFIVGENADSALNDRSADGVVIIPDDIIDNRDAAVKLYNNGSASMMSEGRIKSLVNDIITDTRIARYNNIDLRQIMEQVRSDIRIQTFSNSVDEGEAEEATSTTLSYVLGVGLSLLLYMALLIYGQMVMTSIIEEKNNRVLELVVTSVKPFQLMLGKIAGVGLVAVTQLIIWGVLIGIGATVIMPAIMPADVAQQIASAQSGNLESVSADDIEMVQALAHATDPSFIMGLFFWLIIFLVGGFLLYASIFAAIGSAVDSVQDASQFTSFAVVPIILGIVFGQTAAMNPDSALSIWTSYIPLTSPMVMMSRLPFGVPAWQMVTSAIVLFLSVIFFIWLAGKIYRIGIFMYGKKPSVKDLVRWARYK